MKPRTLNADFVLSVVHGIITAAEQIGFLARAVRGNKDSLLTNFPLPCIAHVNIDKGSSSHYVVIHEIADSQIVIADPSDGLLRIPFDSFCYDNLSNLRKEANYM